MIINSDWHIHSEYSFDASNKLSEIAESALSQGLCRVGITDHANFNDEKFLSDIKPIPLLPLLPRPRSNSKHL